MAILKWDQSGEKIYETGVKKGVLYPMTAGAYPKGIAWNGLTTVSESPSGAEATALYADDEKYLDLMSKEEFGGTIEAYTYPDEFGACDGTAQLVKGITIGQQSRQKFGLSYVTTVGNDEDGDAHGYKIHIVYGCLASPSEKSFASVNDSPEAITFSWEFKTTPVEVTGKGRTSTVVIDSTKVDEGVMAKIEAALYGTADNEAYLPTPDKILEIINAAG